MFITQLYKGRKNWVHIAWVYTSKYPLIYYKRAYPNIRFSIPPHKKWGYCK